MSPCFLEYVQWKDNFTPELVGICTDGDMGQHVFSLEKAQLASLKSCNVSTRVYNNAHSGLRSVLIMSTRLKNLDSSRQIYHQTQKYPTDFQLFSFFELLLS